VAEKVDNAEFVCAPLDLPTRHDQSGVEGGRACRGGPAREQIMWSTGSDPTLGGAVGAAEARRAELTAAAAEDEREEQHENEDYEAAKARAAASGPSTRWDRIRRLLRLGR
jgi:hypothetical protein